MSQNHKNWNNSNSKLNLNSVVCYLYDFSEKNNLNDFLWFYDAWALPQLKINLKNTTWSIKFILSNWSIKITLGKLIGNN